ncbi:ammonia-forming cytochrome c nitrite reductase subunit c552 [Luteolibacter marinus]|uniref:ammonia-forming cytochrome c nitrite reductase subunit c552 n=1 Tax=Luteolibacter marinus TaxID=2776705 RepID=UPI0018694C4E|nr:ammonia-forming cytochrome c nitrite reductase subunit c552 [Luteolibacter marinus]
MTWKSRGWLLAAGAYAALAACGKKETPKTAATPAAPPAAERQVVKAPSSECLDCHQKAAEEWKGSHHALAHRDIGAPADAAAFAELELQVGDASWKFSGGAAAPEIRWEDLADKKAKPIEGKPPMAIGYEPLVQYLVDVGKGRYQVPDMAWDPAKEDWYSIYGDQNRRPHEWGHWTRRGMNWNSQCAYCHFTDLKKGYDSEQDAYHTKWVEQGVGCAQCHGPSRENHGTGECVIDPARKFTPVEWSHTCATCHARREELDENFLPGDSFFDHYQLALPSQPGLWHPDGQQIDEDYNFTSLQLSRMGHKGISCTHCHDPHKAEPLGGREAVESNALCMQCHATGANEAIVIEPAKHTFHDAGTPGSRCVDCHMPKKTYMGRDPRSDHRFPSPDPLLTKELGTPNACNDCHSDKGLDWQIAKVDEWYGDKMNTPARARTRAIAAAQNGHGSLDALLAAFDNEQIGAWKATLLRLMEGWIADERVALRAERAASDADPVARSAAAFILSRRGDRQPVVDKLLADPMKSVRFEAAWGALDRLPADHPAVKEAEEIARHQSDQPGGAMRMARLAVIRRDIAGAEKWFKRAIEWDQSSAAPRRDFAVFLGGVGRTPESVRWLDDAAGLDPENSEIPYLAALGYAELGDTAKAEERLRQTVALNPDFARAHYNLGLLLSGQGKAADAIAALQRAEELNPLDPGAPYARATIHARLGQRDAALKALQSALARDPGYVPALQMKAQLESR